MDTEVTEITDEAVEDRLDEACEIAQESPLTGLWRGIPGRPRYEASVDGRIRRAGQRHRRLATFMHQGQLYVRLNDGEGRRSNQRVDRLVMAAFSGGDPGPRYVTQHLNDDALDCRWINLRWLPRGDAMRITRERRILRYGLTG